MTDQYGRPDARLRPASEGLPELMRFQVHNILYVSTLYESFILAEDGLLNEHMQAPFFDLQFVHAPHLQQAASGAAAIELLESGRSYELVIVGPHLGDMDLPVLLERIHRSAPRLPVVLLAHDYTVLKSLRAGWPSLALEGAFLWEGDARLLLGIVKLVEDRRNAVHDAARGVPHLLVVEDSIRNYSSFLPIIYGEVMRHVERITSAGVSLAQRLWLLRARPRALLATNFEEAWSLFGAYADTVLGVICDVDFPRDGRSDPRAGFDLAARIRQLRPDVPVTLHSSHPANAAGAAAVGAAFLDKRSPAALQQLRHQLADRFAFGDFVFLDRTGRQLARARDVDEFVQLLARVPGASLAHHGSTNDFSRWLSMRAELELATRLRPLRVSDYPDAEALRAALIRAIEQHRQRRDRATIADFHPRRFATTGGVSRVGSGSFGGKARGLAFAARLLDGAELTHRYPGVRVGVPPAVVLATDVFQQFLDENGLRDDALEHADDAAIRRRFRAAALPASALTALEPLAALRGVPLAVRSSHVLEDSPLQPFAGVFDTVLVPNAEATRSRRLRSLQQAVADVFASSFSTRARQLLQGVPFRLESTEMAVLLQQLVGRWRDRRFYPDFAGVARSFNAYPREPARAADGIAAVALGLGKTVVDGGACWRFCPAHPRHAFVQADPDELVDQAQRDFWALSLPPGQRHRLVQFPLEIAEQDGVLGPLGSTYSPAEHITRDGITHAGVRFVSMAGVLKHGAFPLAEILRDLLALFRQAMGAHVELEFAVDMTPDADGRREFALLQVRPLPSHQDDPAVAVELRALPAARVICRSSQVLGATAMESITDLLLMDPHDASAEGNQAAVPHLARLNAELSASGRGYILVGAGRWCSSQPHFGVPVSWQDISGARVIVEGVSRALRAAPSQGSHFFQNLLVAGTHYFAVGADGASDADYIDWEWLARQPAHGRAGPVYHLRFDEPLVVLVDAATRQGAICRPG